jgi:O-antigen/teichoic acid export membrane protein
MPPKRSPGASVARGAMLLLGTQPITWATSLALVVFLPRFLGAEALGEAAVLVTITNLAGAVASLGIPDFLVRRVATRPGRAVADTGVAFALLLAWSCVVAAVMGVATLILNPSTPTPVFVLMSLLTMIAITIQLPVMSLVRGQERHERFALLGVGSSITGVVLGLGVLALGFGLAGYIASSLVSYVLVTAVAMLVAGFRLRRTDFNFGEWKAFTRGGLPFMGNNLTLAIRGQSDRLLLAALANASTVGWYAAAWRVVSIPIFIPTLVMTPLLPALSRCADDVHVFVRTLHRSIEVTLLVMFPCSAMLVAIAPVVPQLLHWGSVFDKSVPLIAVLALQMVLIGPNMVFGVALVALHRERRWLAVVASSAVLDLTLNFLLIGRTAEMLDNGALGAAIASTATEAFTFLAAIAILPRTMELWRLLPVTGRLLLIALLQVLAVQVLLPISILLALGVGSALWVSGMLLLRVLRPEDILMGRRLVAEGYFRVMRRATRTA